MPIAGGKPPADPVDDLSRVVLLLTGTVGAFSREKLGLYYW